jgi:hypothetical protein
MLTSVNSGCAAMNAASAASSSGCAPELHLVIGAGRNIRGEGPRPWRAERQVDQEGADLDLGAVVVAGGDLAGILLRLVLQLHFPQHQLHPVVDQDVAGAVGVALGAASAMPADTPAARAGWRG